MAGLSVATIVVEARERSGALITADFALEEGREVFSVPGEITSTLSAGTNGLLRHGATPLTSAGDVLEALGIECVQPVPAHLSSAAALALEELRRGASSADDLVGASGLDAVALATALAELELAGLVSEGEGIYRALG